MQRSPLLLSLCLFLCVLPRAARSEDALSRLCGPDLVDAPVEGNPILQILWDGSTSVSAEEKLREAIGRRDFYAAVDDAWVFGEERDGSVLQPLKTPPNKQPNVPSPLGRAIGELKAKPTTATLTVIITDGIEDASKNPKGEHCSIEHVKTQLEHFPRPVLFIHTATDVRSCPAKTKHLQDRKGSLCTAFDRRGVSCHSCADNDQKCIEKVLRPSHARKRMPRAFLDTHEDAGVILVDGGWGCTGTLIAPNAVLTAAHCHNARAVRFGPTQKASIMVPVAEQVPHPDPKVDVSLLRLERALSVKPREVRREADPPMSLARLVGFGATDATGTRGAGNKKVLDMPIDGWGCDARRAESTGCRPGKELVITGAHGVDSCAGDSGGPLYELVGAGQRCDFRLLGVTSRSVRDARSVCGSGGIYTRVDAISGWITSTIERWGGKLAN